MRLGLLELRRRPGRFTMAVVIMSLLSLLMLFLGGLLDGLFLGSTGAVRAQRADAIVYSDAARESFLRSRITPEIREQVEAADGVDRVGGLGVALVAASVPGETELADAAVFGYELAPNGVPDPPAPGEAWADRRLESFGVDVGETLELGPQRVPLTVIGFVDDTNYLLQGGLWVEPGTWRAVQNASRPDATVADGVFQVLVVQGSGDLPDAIDAATGGATVSLSRDAAVNALPGIKEQRSTFNQIIGTTGFVAAVVVGLFFSLLTLERTGIYGVLKAVGASSRQLLAGVVSQAVAVSLIAFAIATVLGLIADATIPPGAVPYQLEPSRIVITAVVVVAAAVFGSIVSLRRVVRIDPASAIGSSPL